MGNVVSSFWSRCAIVFILMIILKGILTRIFLADDPEGGNLLVNAVFALSGTIVYAIADIAWRRLRKRKK